MLDFKQKYKQLSDLFDFPTLSEAYKDANDFEKCVLMLRRMGMSYGIIQSKLGNPPKKLIRNVLLKWDPDLIDNSIKKHSPQSDSYNELYTLLSNTDRTMWEIFGEESECCIKNSQILYDGEPLKSWSEVEQAQILNEIKAQWN